MRKSLRIALNKVAKLLEKRASLAQGKGWGSSTIASEVAALFSFLETPPPNMYRHWGQRWQLHSIVETLEFGLSNPRF